MLNPLTDEQVLGNICIIPRSFQGKKMTICSSKDGSPGNNLRYPCRVLIRRDYSGNINERPAA